MMTTVNKGIARVVVLTLASTMILGGCGWGMGGCDGEKAGEVVIEDDSVKPALSEYEEGPQYQTPTMENLQGVEQKFPAKYPVKKYPNSRVVMAYVRPDLVPGQKNVVLLNSSDRKEVVSAYYRTELAKEGWKLTYQYENLAFTQLIYKKGDQEIEVRVTPDPQGKKHVQLLAGPYKPMAVYSQELPKSVIRKN